MTREIHTMAVIGAGDRGREMAAAALRAGYRVILEDVSQPRLEQAAAALSGLGEGARSRLVLTSNLEGALREADLVIEVVAEELEMKIEMFTIFDKFTKPDAILASSALSLSIADMASVTFCAERCIGMRFSHSAGGANVLELVRSPKTSQETLAACSEVGRRMGKQVVVLSEVLAGSEAVQASEVRTNPRASQKAAAGQD
jgi:3-hydroxybutyryl-CoA dehydrogenase